MGIEIKFYNLDTFKKQVDANCIDLNSEFVDLNYKAASLIFCHFWHSIHHGNTVISYYDYFFSAQQNDHTLNLLKSPVNVPHLFKIPNTNISYNNFHPINTATCYLFTNYSQNRSSVPPKILLMN